MREAVHLLLSFCPRRDRPAAFVPPPLAAGLTVLPATGKPSLPNRAANEASIRRCISEHSGPRVRGGGSRCFSPQLAKADAETVAKLKAAGFTVTRQAGAMVWGRLAGNRLPELVKLDAVRWIALP